MKIIVKEGFIIPELQLEIPQKLDTLQLPDPELLTYWKLEENRIFYVEYEIDESLLEIQKNIININLADIGIDVDKRKPIKILINTPGGLLAETMSLAGTIIMSKTPVITINMASAFSGGCLLLLAGHKRYAMPFSYAMVHTGSAGMSGTFEQNEQFQKMYKKQVDEMGNYILDRTGMDRKMFNRNRAKDWYMDTNEQVQYGVVHEVIKDLDEIL